MAVFFCTGILSLSVSAAGSADTGTITILERFDPAQNSFMSYMFRYMGWGLIKFLRFLVNGIETAIYSITGSLGGFFTSAGIDELIHKKLIPLALAVLVLVIIFIGIQYIIKPRDTGALVSNLVVGLLIAVALPTFMSYGFQLSQAAIDTLGNDKGGSIANQVLLDNTTDMLLYDQNDFSAANLPKKSHYAKNNDAQGLMRINPTEMIDPSKAKHPEVWSNEVVVDSNGNKTLEAFENPLISSVVPPLKEGYYRWQVDWLTAIVTLLVSALAMTITSIRIAKLLFELVIQQALAQILGLLDIYSAQRLKKCLQSIVGSFATFFGCFVLLQFYLIGMQYITNITNVFARLVCMIALAILLISGPNIFEQLFGQNLGGQRGSLMSTFFGAQTALGLMGAAKRGMIGTKGADGHRHGGVVPGVANVAGKAAGAAGKTADMAGGVVGAVGGAAAGAAIGGIGRIKTAKAAGGGEAKKGIESSGQSRNLKEEGAVSPGASGYVLNGVSSPQAAAAEAAISGSYGKKSNKRPESAAPEALQRSKPAMAAPMPEEAHLNSAEPAMPDTGGAGTETLPTATSATPLESTPSSPQAGAAESQSGAPAAQAENAKGLAGTRTVRQARRAYALSYNAVAARPEKKAEVKGGPPIAAPKEENRR